MNCNIFNDDSVPPSKITECNPEQYLAWCRVALSRGAPLPQWTTREQFLALRTEFPDHVKSTPRRLLQDIGVNDIVPLNEPFLERLLVSLEQHPHAVEALSVLLRRAAT